MKRRWEKNDPEFIVVSQKPDIADRILELHLLKPTDDELALYMIVMKTNMSQNRMQNPDPGHHIAEGDYASEDFSSKASIR